MACLNQATVQPQDGNFMPPHNCLHEGNREYLIEAVQAERFGGPLYPTIIDKAALYCHSIICNHLFFDGNNKDWWFRGRFGFSKPEWLRFSLYHDSPCPNRLHIAGRFRPNRP